MSKPSREKVIFSNIRTCPYCNSQDIETEYCINEDKYKVHCVACGRYGYMVGDFKGDKR